ncbi:hypothetical protein [Nocardioides soli]|uniref:Uncharacterized protein n=1 Tax=Nocardioides soli TaxID=1036020 RepID=A0A7W4YZQ4_9ACTN|nr:hypothetical protein [Nocardioides soli]MBB3040998.1 hypothetical protein [Nocardioides soli]
MATQTAPDVSDLDMLDDAHRHARCCICTGTFGPLIGVPYRAICGRRAINLREWDDPMTFPPDACHDCLRLWSAGCPTCP